MSTLPTTSHLIPAKAGTHPAAAAAKAGTRNATSTDQSAVTANREKSPPRSTHNHTRQFPLTQTRRQIKLYCTIRIEPR